jgi:HEAT repeat protein
VSKAQHGQIDQSLPAETDTLNTLLFALSSPEVEQRWSAAGELAAMGEVAVTPLMTLYETTDWTVQHIIIWALGEIRSDTSYDLLVAALDHAQIHVRLSAARALEKHPKRSGGNKLWICSRK